MPRNPSRSALLPAHPRRRGRPAASAPQDIPRFTLYGDTEGARVDRLHVETLQSRSQLYHWEIDAHVHAGHYQLFWLRRGPAEVALDESRSTCEGPAVIAIPPGVVHAFRFSATTDGLVVTLSPHALTEGDPPIEPAALGEQVAALRRARDGDFHCNAIHLRALRVFAEEVQAAGSTLVLSVAPLAPRSVASREAVSTKLAQCLRELDLPSTQLLTHEARPEFTERDFRDLIHLNRDGAERFTRWSLGAPDDAL